MSATSTRGEFPPGYQLRCASAADFTVGKLLAQGGLGFVYEVAEDPAVVLKQIKREVLARSPELPERVRAMIANRPAGWLERTGHVVLAWPSDIALDGSCFVGFLMPRIDMNAAVELHNVANPSDRHDRTLRAPDWLTGFTWHYHLRVAANLALATAMLHDRGYVIGDFNERNVLVTDEARVTLVDCDSMQVPNRDGAPFLCTVGVPDFTAPELRRVDLATTQRRPSSDAFALAVHLHQLLLHNAHPFDGRWQGPGDKPGRTELAARGIYVHAAHQLLSPPDGTIGFDVLPKGLRNLFVRAFVDGARDPASRPTGGEWKAALDATERTLVECGSTSAHVYPGHVPHCPWCALEVRTQPVQTPLPHAHALHAPPSPKRAQPPPRLRPPVAAPPPPLPPRPPVAAPAPPPRASPPFHQRARAARRTLIGFAAALVLATVAAVAISAAQRSHANSDATTSTSSTPAKASTHRKRASTKKKTKQASARHSTSSKRKQTSASRAKRRAASTATRRTTARPRPATSVPSNRTTAPVSPRPAHPHTTTSTKSPAAGTGLSGGSGGGSSSGGGGGLTGGGSSSSGSGLSGGG